MYSHHVPLYVIINSIRRPARRIGVCIIGQFAKSADVRVFDSAFDRRAQSKTPLQVLQNLLPQEKMLIRNSAVIIHSHDAQSDMERVISFLTEHHIRFQGIESAQPTLEDVFLRMTGAGYGAGEREECI